MNTATAPFASPHHYRRVLIVDDHADNRCVLKFVLEQKGMVVMEACNGQEGVEMASRELPDLILMDLSMPIMDGLEATRQIKAFAGTRHIPIIALSAFCGEYEDKRIALQVGCHSCLDKPFDFGALETMINSF